MTTPDSMDRDDELEELLRMIASDRARVDDVEVHRAVERLYGRPDALELLRDVAREEQLLRLLHIRAGIGSGRAGDARRDPERRAFSIASNGPRSHSPANAARWKTIGLVAAAALVVALALNSSVALRLLGSLGGGVRANPHTAITLAAELDTLNLPDGSRVILAPNSTLRYSMAALAGPRDLQLEGEALFDVKHDVTRPFRVRTRRAVVEDLGTTFVVREYAEDSRARVAVRSGAAALRTGDGSSAAVIDLRSGDGAYVDSSGSIARFTGDPESFGAWTAGYLEFDGAPLPDVLSQLETWFDVEFQMNDSTLTKQHFTGGLSSTSLPKALEILGPIVHARFAQEGRVVEATARLEGR